MEFREEKSLELVKEGFPFSIEWIRSDPSKVEAILRNMPLADQARCVMRLTGEEKQDLLLLSKRGKEVVQALPPEEVYFMVKEIGQEDALPVLSATTQEQMQYIFDIEWWQKDQFMPKWALEWLNLLNKNNDLAIFNWFVNEDSDQIIMVLQSLIKVYKKDEMTDSCEGVEGWANFTPDGIYDVFISVPEAVEVLKRFLKLLFERQPAHFYNLMEGVIWNPITPTVEKAYRWRLTRTASHGIPDYEEALEVYSRLDPDALSQSVASPDNFTEPGDPKTAPYYVFSQVDPSKFFGLCLSFIDDRRRLETLRWELVYLANKVMVADQADPSNPNHGQEVRRKVLGWINIGLELGSWGDTQRGIKLLEQTWLQPLFQVGYGCLMQLKLSAQKLTREFGGYIEFLLEDEETEEFNALVIQSVPHRKENKTGSVHHFQSLSEVREMEKQLQRYLFFIRFTRKALNMTPDKLETMVKTCIIPSEAKECSLIWLATTALANSILFKELSCQPLSDVAAKSFLELIFLPGNFEGEPRTCNQDHLTIDPFLVSSLAWTPQDRDFIKDLLKLCEQNLLDHFGRIDLNKPIKWEFTRGLFIRRARARK